MAVQLSSISLLAFTGCADESNGDPVSAREQKQLPTSPGSLIQDLCFRGDSETDRLYVAKPANWRARRQFRALERSLRRHPEAIVRAEITLAESPEPEIRKMTVRELAVTHLEAAKEGEVLPEERQCYRRGQARLERLLSANA
ncbi:MAG: hypothetical protein QOF06_921 [Solirubrobacterales bacterium]|jgi:hypothetical protein|nr:hypothetical protein [Solirubrobacterales bacterium]